MCIEELQRWFRDHVTTDGKKYELDDEQAAIVLDEHKNAIVTARAGSGKTHTIIAKITYLVAKKQVDPTHILALGFYKEPQKDFNNRLKKVAVDGVKIFEDSSIARTFHSLAYGISSLKGSVLMDDNKNKEYHLTEYIDRIVKEVVDERKIYGFIRDDSYQPKSENYKTEEDYKLACKYTRYDTLHGEMVKSRGEKIIADYLFEHGLDYGYEIVSFYPSKLAKYAKEEDFAEELKNHDKITPDFVLKEENIIWEHWGIRGDETEAEIDEINQTGAIGSYREYYDNMEFKKEFYSKDWLDSTRIETKEAKEDEYLQKFLSYETLIYSNYQKDQSREDFEAVINDVLREASIYAEKLPEEELLALFGRVNNNNSRTTERVKQFIQRAEQQFPNDLAGLVAKCQTETEKQTKLFYEVSLAAYDYYLKDLTSDPQSSSRGLIRTLFPGKVYVTDHSLNLANAAEVLDSGAYDDSDPMGLKKLEYIFLDEYQDFSLLFHGLISAILRQNSSIKILAVGDDWQAISGYAGASLEYFDNFEKYFSEDVTRLKISTNRRSSASIVEITNDFMLNSLDDGNGATFIKADKGDVLTECILEDIHNYSKIDPEDYSNGYKKYSLLVSEIIKDNPGKTIKFLSRTNKIKFGDGDTRNINTYQNDIAALYHNHLPETNLKENIDFATVNSSKGLESDIVVILESDPGRFPIFHPDNHLYKVFGETEQAALDEQKRLFYVAMTRAKEKIYIIHDRNINITEQKDRNFLSLLDLSRFKRYYKDVFLSIAERIKRDLVNSFVAVKVVMKPNRYEKNNIDIIATAKNGDKVYQYNAFSDSASVRQMRRYVRECTKSHPMKIKATHSKPYGSTIYLKFFDSNSTSNYYL